MGERLHLPAEHNGTLPTASSSIGTPPEQTRRSGRRILTRRNFLRTALGLTGIGALGGISIKESHRSRLDEIRRRCQELMEESVAKERQGYPPPPAAPEVIAEEVAMLSRMIRYRSIGDVGGWDFVLGDFELTEINETDGSTALMSRCGGAARHFIENAAAKGFDDVRMYFALWGREALRDRFKMHYYGTAGKGDRHWLLVDGGETNFRVQESCEADIAPMLARRFRGSIMECFRCLRPQPAMTDRFLPIV